MEGERGGAEGGWTGGGLVECAGGWGMLCVGGFFFSSGGEGRGWWDAGFDWRLWISGLDGWVGGSMSGTRGVEDWGCLLGNIEVACEFIVVTIIHSDQDDGTMEGEDA